MKKSFWAIIAVILLVSCGKKADETGVSVGSVVRDTIQGVPCCVYLPNAYAERVQSGVEVFPVLYLQHGMFGCEDDWTTQGNLLHWMDSLLQCGAVKEMVIIMPDNCPHRPTYEEERANAMDGHWEGGFAQFMAETESRYHVSNQPAQRAIAGLSMGGYHTRQVSQHLPGQFGYIALFSALVTPPYSLEGNEKALYWIGMGKEDFLYEQLQPYRQWLEANHYEYTYYESPGGHTWPNWQDYLCRFLPKLFK